MSGEVVDGETIDPAPARNTDVLGHATYDGIGVEQDGQILNE